MLIRSAGDADLARECESRKERVRASDESGAHSSELRGDTGCCSDSSGSLLVCMLASRLAETGARVRVRVRVRSVVCAPSCLRGRVVISCPSWIVSPLLDPLSPSTRASLLLR